MVTYTEPFSGSDLLKAAQAARPGQGSGQHTCVLVDLRAVDISTLTGSDSRAFAIARKDRISGEPAEPVAFLLRDMREFGTMRMHNQWQEALGLRNEEDAFVTTSPRSALEWLVVRTGKTGMATSLTSRFDGGEP